MFLRQSTASQEILLGPFLDSTDGNTAETALSIANTDIKVWKDGATTEANKNSGGATHIAAGRYYAVLDATDTNTLGNLEVNVHVAGALAVRRAFVVLPAVVYDSLVLGTDNLEVDAVSLPSIPSGWITAAGIAATALDDKGNWNVGKAGYELTQAFPSNFADLSVTATTGLVDITQAAADKAWGTATRVLTANTNLNDPSAAAIRAEVDNNSTQLAAIKAKTDALPASPAATGDIPTVSGIADGVWDEAQAGHTTAGTFGLYLDAAVSSAGGGSLTVADIVDGVWDEALAGHLTSGSTGAALNAAGAGGDPWETTIPGAYGAGTAGKILGDNINATISSRATQTTADAIQAKTDALPASPAATGDVPTAAAIRAEVDTNSTELAAIKAKTDALPASPAATGDIPTAAAIRAEVDANSTELAAIKAKTDALPASPAATGDIPTAAAIRAEVDTNSTELAAIKGRLPAALSGGRMVANTEAVDGSTQAANRLKDHALRAVPVTFTSGTTTTAVLSQVDGAAASSTNDVYNGRVLVFSAPSTLKDQACTITDYDGATATATISAVTTAVGATTVAVLV